MLIGTVGVGGVLMVAYLALFAGLSIHQAAATALFSFLFTGLLGTVLYQRRGSIDWRITAPVCAGAIVFGKTATPEFGFTAITKTVFGGATTRILRDMTLPVLMAH